MKLKHLILVFGFWATTGQARLQGRCLQETSIERLSPEFDSLVPPHVSLEQIVEGLTWAEGPVWISEGGGKGYLLFSDTRANTVWKWKDGVKTVFLAPSGCTTDKSRCEGVNEPGANGLTVDINRDAALVMCQHGERRVARMEKDGTFTSLATHYQGKRLNSPNDLVMAPWGDLYFTDPPYGLNGFDEDPAKDLPINGVYRVPAASVAQVKTSAKEGATDVQAIYTAAKRPNGLTLSADHRRLYVSNSWEPDPHWVYIDLNEDGSPANSGVWKSALPYQLNGTRTGNPDGLKVTTTGHIFATGPGGVLVFNNAGEHLGTLLMGSRNAANLAFGGDGYLYICATDSVFRVPALAKPASKPPL